MKKNLWQQLSGILPTWGKRIVQALANIPNDKHLHFEAGTIIAGFFTLVWPLGWPVIPVVCIGLAKEAIDEIGRGKGDWKDLLATTLGGCVVQIMLWL